MEKKNNNMKVYDAVCIVPQEAKKPIGAGRLSGKTDINPMWRIKMLTEQFGMCGIGWYYTVTDRWMETAANGEVKAFVNIELYVKVDGEWSMPILGNGGSSFVEHQRNGDYVNDECYKMATTDALSVACKQLGMGADVYWAGDNTKYNDVKREAAESAAPKTTKKSAAQQKVEAVTMVSKALNAEPQPAPRTAITTTTLPEGITQEYYNDILQQLAKCQTRQEVKTVHASFPALANYQPFRDACNGKFKTLAA